MASKVSALRADLAPVVKAFGVLAQMDKLLDDVLAEETRMRQTEQTRKLMLEEVNALKLERDKVTKGLADARTAHAAAVSDLKAVTKELDAARATFGRLADDHASKLAQERTAHDKELDNDKKQHEIAIDLLKSAFAGTQAELNAAKKQLADFHANVLSAAKK